MAAKIAYVVIEGITSKDGGWTSKKTGEPQVKWNLRCTGKSGAQVWFNMFDDPDKENTILKDFESGQGAKITFLQTGDKGQFKNVVGISHAEVKVERKADSGGGDQDKIMMQACLKAAGGGAVGRFTVNDSVDKVSQFIWDVAEDLFLKLNGRRFGATPASSPREASGKVAKPASAEMSKEESQGYLEDPPREPSGEPPVSDEVPEDEEIPF